MMMKKLVLAVACAATLFTADVGMSSSASANDAAAGAAAGFVGGMILGGALAGAAQPVPDEEVVVRRRRPVRVYEEEEYVRPRRCWTENWRDRWGDYHERRVCR